jgi:hypothetical protein
MASLDVLIMGRDAERQQFLNCTFADQEIAIVAIANDDRHTTAHEVERNFVDFPVVLQLVDKFVLQSNFENGNVK